MNILIVGINGFLGTAIAEVATRNGLNVFGVCRSEVAEHAIEATCIVADRRSPDAIGDIVSGNHIDVVVDVLAMTLKETLPLIERLEDHVAQFVMLSSGDVYRNYELLHRRAEGQALQVGADENSALRTTRFPYRSDPRRPVDDPDTYLDDYDKIPVEEAVRQLATNWTILRLPMVYGPGDRQRRFRWAIGHMAGSQAPLTLPQRWADWTTTYGYIDDVAAGIALTVGNPEAANATFNIGEQRPVSQLRWAARIAGVMGWEGEIRTSDDPDNAIAQRVRAIDLAVPFRIDSGAIRRTLGFGEAVPVEEGLTRTVEDERVRG